MKTAVIGVGRMGRRHVQAARQLGWEIAGVYDVSRESLLLTQQEQSVPERLLFDDISKLFAEAKPEVVIIATTADSHCDLTCLAAENGARFILVEKPMAVSLEQCDRMIDACERAGAKLSINHQMRFMEQYTEPRRLISSEAYGSFASMTLVAGSIGFSMNGSHFFEAFRYVAGEAPSEVTAWFSPEILSNPRGPQFQDRAGMIRATTPSGKRLVMEIDADQGYGLFVIYTSRYGMITVNEITGELNSIVREEQHRELPTSRVALPAIKNQQMLNLPGVIDTTAAVMQAMVNDNNRVSGEDGRRVVELLVAAYESAERGGLPVQLDTGLDRKRVFPWA